MLNARNVEIIHAVMRTGSVRGAARLLGTAQPGLSRMLRHIEDRLGYALFDRTSGRLVPTQEAHMLAAHVEEVHKSLLDLDRVARSIGSGEQRLFRIAASPSLGHSIVPTMLVDLARIYPDIVLQLEILSVEQTDDYLALGRGDYTVTVFPMTQPSIHSVRLGAVPLVLAVHADHPLAGADHVSAADLAGCGLATFRENTPHGTAIATMLGGHPRNVKVYVRFGETALAFVAEGLAATIVDAFTARQPRDPGIRIIPITDTVTLPICLNRNLSAARSAIGVSFERIARERLRFGTAGLASDAGPTSG